ncbi:hypothetical protein EVG20_g4848 [Dentipellis fragilis]|uniref:Uncharacterized protein n=1 Tax=Dentipellis fragilis TaxID=205917 RepID=A0A4Y9YWZ5_9AGAM|nr:hypothetical protein EVG20_g4848 [Dentipellis fragilis]
MTSLHNKLAASSPIPSFLNKHLGLRSRARPHLSALTRIPPYRGSRAASFVRKRNAEQGRVAPEGAVTYLVQLTVVRRAAGRRKAYQREMRSENNSIGHRNSETTFTEPLPAGLLVQYASIAASCRQRRRLYSSPPVLSPAATNQGGITWARISYQPCVAEV